MTSKQYETQNKEYCQQFTDQMKAFDAKLTMDNSILSHIHEIYKRRAIIEQEYSDQLFKLAASVSQKVKTEDMRRSKWKNYSPQTVLTCVLVSMQHSARGHKSLSEILSKQMTQRITDIQEDNNRLTRKINEQLGTHQSALNVALTQLAKKQKDYFRAYAEAEECRKKASKLMEQLDREVVRCQDKKKEVEKNKSIKKLKEDFLEKEKLYTEKQADSIVYRNKYLIHVQSLNATLKQFFGTNLEAFLQTRDFGFHNNMTRLCMNQASCETSLQSMHETINEMFERTIEKIDAVSDAKVFKSVHSSALTLNSIIPFVSAKNDQCCEVLKGGDKVDKTLDDMYKSIAEEFDELKKVSDKEKRDIEVISKKLQNIIDQKDYDVAEYFSTSNSNNIESSMTLSSNSKTNSLSRVRTGSQDGSMGSLSPTTDHSYSPSGVHLYSTLQKNYRNERIELEKNYTEAMNNYLLAEIRVVNLDVKIKSIKSAKCPNYLTNTNNENGDLWSSLPSFLNSPTSETPDDGGIQVQTALLIGKREKLFGGDLKKYSEDLRELVPTVVRSCIRLISQHGMSTVGVFRVPGSQNDVISYREKFSMGQNPLLDLKGTNNDVNLAASILKSYFRELDPPIFDSSMFTKCVDNYDTIKNDPNKMIDFLRNLVSDAHPAVYATTKYLLAFLNHMEEFSSLNCMDMMNLAIIFGPCLIPIPNNSASQQFQYQGVINQLTECLIRNSSVIYNRTLPIGCDTLKYEYCQVDYSASTGTLGSSIDSTPDSISRPPNLPEEKKFALQKVFTNSQKLRRNESTHNMPSKTANTKGKARHASDSEAADRSSQSSIRDSSSEPVLFEAVAIAEYLPRSPTELSLSNGMRVFVTQKMTDQWLYGHTVNSGGIKSPSGRVPMTYIREVTKVSTPKEDKEEGEDKKVSAGSARPSATNVDTAQPPDEEWQQAIGTLQQLDKINIRKNRSTFSRNKNELTMSKFVSPLSSNHNHDSDDHSSGQSLNGQTTIQEFLLAEGDREVKARSLQLDNTKDKVKPVSKVSNALTSAEKIKSASVEFKIKKPSKLISEIAGQFEMASNPTNTPLSIPPPPLATQSTCNTGSTRTLNLPPPPPTLPKPRKIPAINK